MSAFLKSVSSPFIYSCFLFSPVLYLYPSVDSLFLTVQIAVQVKTSLVLVSNAFFLHKGVFFYTHLYLKKMVGCDDTYVICLWQNLTGFYF